MIRLKPAMPPVLILLLALLIPPPSLGDSSFEPGRILVKFRPGTPASTASSIDRQNGSRVLAEIPQIGVQTLTAPRGQEIALAKRYESNPNVEFAEPDGIVYVTDLLPNDPWFPSQWGLERIQAPEAWNLCGGSGSVIVAVLDTGVDYRHPDLAGRVLPGYDFLNNDSDPMDDNGHGTAVAGIIAANADNGIGVSGVTLLNPVMPVKVFSASGASLSSLVAQGITYAVDHGAKVISMSFGISYSSTLKSAVDYAFAHNVVMAAAAGNGGTLGVYCPAAYPNVLAVGCSNQYDQWSGSNYGPELDVLAPDSTVTTTLGGGYGNFGATSGATPFVSGICALVLSASPSLSSTQVQQIVTSSAEDVLPLGWDQYSGWGRINAYEAVAAAISAGTAPKDTNPPTVMLLTPAQGAVVSGNVSLSASAEDDIGVSRVEFYENGSLVGTSVQSPFSFTCDTSSWPDGAVTISARAYDAAGNSAVSPPVIVTVRNQTAETYTFRGSLSTRGTTEAYYPITLSTPASVSASLSFSKADLDLHLLDASGHSVASKLSGSRPLSISTGILPAGDYAFEVVCVSGKSRYTLNVSSTP